MNIYKYLNEITDYIENNIYTKINYEIFAKIMGVNIHTMQSIFYMITGIHLSEYIRKRRLSLAGIDLLEKNIKVIDIALKYGYDNATSFSRAFTNFHGIKPSKVKEKGNLNFFPKLVFDTTIKNNQPIEYMIDERGPFILYGFSIKTNNIAIKDDAPNFFENISNNYREKYGEPNYGLITYDIERDNCNNYYVLYDKKIKEKNIEKITIPKNKFLIFRIKSQEAKDIQEMSRKFYDEFLPSSKYKVKSIPELEYYHDEITDFLVPIY